LETAPVAGTSAIDKMIFLEKSMQKASRKDKPPWPRCR
jgi:hypothetical protein